MSRSGDCQTPLRSHREARGARNDIGWRQALLPLGGLTGGLLAMAVMALSPSNLWRQAAMPPPDSLWQLVGYSLRYSLDFIVYSLRGQPLPNLAFAAVVALAAFLAFARARPPVKPGRAAAGVALSLAAGFLLVVCCVAPSVYAGLNYPAGRALMPARFAMLIGLSGAATAAAAAVYGWLTRSSAERPISPRLTLAAAILLLACCIYPARALPLLQAEIADLQVRAARFDERDARIRADAANGLREVAVRQVDVVQGLEDLGADPEFWVNRCAGAYYGVDEIRAYPLSAC